MRQIPLFGVSGSPEAEAAVLAVLRSGRIASGPHVAEFEAGIAAITGLANVVSTVDMTSAMFLALHLAGVGPGDEVLTTAFACMATNSAIAQTGATPVWIDLMPKSVEIDLADIASKVSSKTKALILYHVAGYPGPSEQVAALCREHGIALVEDCDNALFAMRGGAHVGTHGDFAVFSFYPNRQINCTEGGALACKSPAMAARARQLRRFGIDAAGFRTAAGEIDADSDIPEIGWAMTMNNLCAAIGLTQLATARDKVDVARRHVSRLEKWVAGIDGLEVIVAAADAQPAYWVMLLLASDRDRILRSLKSDGVMASKLHQRNDRYTGFRAAQQPALRNTAYLQDHILAIPCGWWLEEGDIVAIGKALERAAGGPAK